MTQTDSGSLGNRDLAPGGESHALAMLCRLSGGCADCYGTCSDNVAIATAQAWPTWDGTQEHLVELHAVAALGGI